MVLKLYLEEAGRLDDFSHELSGRFRMLDKHCLFKYT